MCPSGAEGAGLGPLLERLRRWGPAATLHSVAAGAPVPASLPLPELVEDYAREIGTTLMPVAASLFLQRYAYRLLTPAVIAWITEDVIPDLGRDNVGVGCGSGRDLSFTLLSPSTSGRLSWDGGVAWVSRRLVEGHLDALAREVAGIFGLNPRPLRSNAAAPLLYTFGVCDRVPGLRSRSRGVREGMLAALFGAERPRLISAGRPDGGRLTLLDRRCCCLKHLLPGGASCAECPLLPEAERRTRLHDLAGHDRLLTDLHPPERHPGPVAG